MIEANSSGHFKAMMTDLKQRTEKQGLKIHPDKTNILTNPKSNRAREVAIEGIWGKRSLSKIRKYM